MLVKVAYYASDSARFFAQIMLKLCSLFKIMLLFCRKEIIYTSLHSLRFSVSPEAYHPKLLVSRNCLLPSGVLRRSKDREGDIGVFGFTVLVIFEIVFSGFALKMSGFSVFPFLNIRFSVFTEK